MLHPSRVDSLYLASTAVAVITSNTLKYCPSLPLQAPVYPSACSLSWMLITCLLARIVWKIRTCEVASYIPSCGHVYQFHVEPLQLTCRTRTSRTRSSRKFLKCARDLQNRCVSLLVATMRLLLLFHLLLSLAPFTAWAAVLAIDYGSDWTKASLMAPGVPFDVLLNKDSKRKIQSSIGWKQSDRLFGTDAFNLVRRASTSARFGH